LATSPPTRSWLRLAERVRSFVRTSDVACRVGGDEFAVILPESGLVEAEGLYRRLQFAIGNSGTGPVDRLHISAGVAELRPGDGPVTFFERADEALYRAKESGKVRRSPRTTRRRAVFRLARTLPRGVWILWRTGALRHAHRGSAPTSENVENWRTLV
jgi:GGDEF domain-containing protein